MTKNIKVHDAEFVYIEDFKDFIDVDRIVFYALKPKKDGTLIVKFYDKNKKLIKPYVK